MNLSMLKPLIAATASVLMCCIFILTQSIRAHDVTELGHQVKVINADNLKQIEFHVDSKTIEWHDLNSEQQAKYLRSQRSLKTLEQQLEAQMQQIEQRSLVVKEKTTRLRANLMETMARYLEDVEFQQVQNRAKLRIISELSEQAQLAVEEIKALEVQIPEIDQTLIRAVEQEADNLEILLIEIADNS